jgi:hypothetical protein
MSYLYGDSTPTELKSNFLEFLRDAIDFGVFLLEADAGIKRGKERIQRNTEAMEAEIGRLEHFIAHVSRSIREAEKGAVDSATAACATYLEKLVAESQRTSVTAMRTRLAHYVAGVDAEEAASRAACFKALETLLAPHDPPDAATVTRLVLVQPGRYDAAQDGRSAFGLAWTFAMAIPDGTLWSSPVRIERLAQNLELRAPQLSGWISKEVKVRPQKLDRHVVTELVLDNDIVQMKLRPEPGIETGFDFSVDLAANAIRAVRIGPAEGDASVGPFDIVAEDAALIVDLAQKLRAGAAAMTRRELTTAMWRDGEFSRVPTFIDVVERLVAMMTPITLEIAKRSLKPTELVLRRMLGNDRREEVFVEKATLREKYETLAPPLRTFFAPLGFDPPAEPAATPPPAEAVVEQPTRAEIARSQRPPPPVPKTSAPPDAPDLTAAPILEELTVEPFEQAPSAPPTDWEMDSTPPVEVLITPDASEPPSALTSASASASSIPVPPVPPVPPFTPPSSPPLSVSGVSSTPPPKVPTPPPLPTRSFPADIPPPPESSQNPITKLDKEGATKNVELIAALKKIVSLSRSGNVDDAYREYATLFSSPTFADYRPEEQRQALKLMVLAKVPPPKNDVVLDAYRAALTRLEVLANAVGEPADLEMLGATHVMFGDVSAANAAFARALEIERARNPSSELIGRVMTRVASL